MKPNYNVLPANTLKDKAKKFSFLFDTFIYHQFNKGNVYFNSHISFENQQSISTLSYLGAKFLEIKSNEIGNQLSIYITKNNHTLKESFLNLKNELMAHPKVNFIETELWSFITLTFDSEEETELFLKRYFSSYTI